MQSLSYYQGFMRLSWICPSGSGLGLGSGSDSDSGSMQASIQLILNLMDMSNRTLLTVALAKVFEVPLKFEF